LVFEKLKLFITAGIVSVSCLAPAHLAMAEPAEWDQRIARLALNNPAGGLIFAEVKFFEDGSTTPKACHQIWVSGSSQEGKRLYLPVQSLSSTPGNTFYAGWAILAPGTYTITSVRCGDYLNFKGPFARFSVNTGHVLNLGSLVIKYKNAEFKLFFQGRPTGNWKVEDLSPNAIATLKQKSPAAFSKASKQHMIPVRPTAPSR
jgi:hypothetical protein